MPLDTGIPTGWGGPQQQLAGGAIPQPQPLPTWQGQNFGAENAGYQQAYQHALSGGMPSWANGMTLTPHLGQQTVGMGDSQTNVWNSTPIGWVQDMGDKTHTSWSPTGENLGVASNETQNNDAISAMIMMGMLGAGGAAIGGAGAAGGMARGASDAGLAAMTDGGAWGASAVPSIAGTGGGLSGVASAMPGAGPQSGGFMDWLTGGKAVSGLDWLRLAGSVGSGLYGMSQADKMRELSKQSVAGSAPWVAGGGQANAAEALTRVINGDLGAGGRLAQLNAARGSAQQPGGYAASADALAKIRHQNETIAALGPAAGVGFNPGAGYQTALGGQQAANSLDSASLGSIGFGLGGQNQMPPWFKDYLMKQGLGV